MFWKVDGLGAWDWFETWAKCEAKASTMWEVLMRVSVEFWSVCGVEKERELWMTRILFQISKIGIWRVKEDDVYFLHEVRFEFLNVKSGFGAGLLETYMIF